MKINCKMMLVNDSFCVFYKLFPLIDETIQFMRLSDIKVWVLTGDKVGTARSIATSCKLIEHQMIEVLIDGKTCGEVEESLNAARSKLEQAPKAKGKYCIVTGDAMLSIYKNHKLETIVLKLQLIRNLI